MAQKVAGRPRRRKPPAVSRERRRAQQQAVRARLGAAIAAVIRAAIEAALEAEVTALLGRGGTRGARPPRCAGPGCAALGVSRTGRRG